VTVANTAPSITVAKTANPTSVPEPGGSVQYTVRIDNTSNSQDPVTITSLTDDRFGNLNGQGSCAVPQTIQPGQSYSCTFSKTISGNAGVVHTNRVTASGVDNDTTPVSGSDDATVTIANANPSITVSKSANPSGVPSGGTVQYAVQINNTSNAQDPVTISSLSDNKFGNLNGQGACVTPQTIQPGASYSCTFVKTISGAVGSTHVNTATASGTDNDGTAVSGQGSATVVIMPGAPCPASVSGWAGEYWNNSSLIGTPVLCRDDPSIAFVWNEGSPSPSIQPDQFSARWTRPVNFAAGT
jgi:hypothetical protein